MYLVFRFLYEYYRHTEIELKPIASHLNLAVDMGSKGTKRSTIKVI